LRQRRSSISHSRRIQPCRRRYRCNTSERAEQPCADHLGPARRSPYSYIEAYLTLLHRNSDLIWLLSMLFLKKLHGEDPISFYVAASHSWEATWPLLAQPQPCTPTPRDSAPLRLISRHLPSQSILLSSSYLSAIICFPLRGSAY
jgi:hypothetical protein